MKQITEYIEKYKQYFNCMDLEAAQAMAAMLRADKVIKRLEHSDKGGYNMCKALDDLYNDGVAEGEIKGEAKGKIDSILDFLADYGVVSDYLREKISSESDIEILKKWTKLSARVSSIGEFEEKMSDINHIQ